MSPVKHNLSKTMTFLTVNTAFLLFSNSYSLRAITIRAFMQTSNMEFDVQAKSKNKYFEHWRHHSSNRVKLMSVSSLLQSKINIIVLHRALQTWKAIKLQKENLQRVEQAMTRIYLHWSKARIFRVWHQVSQVG